MNMVAGRERHNNLADILPVLNDRIAFLEIGQCNLVADGNILPCSKGEVGIIFGNYTKHFVAGLEVFNHDNADVVTFIVYQQMRNGHLQNPFAQFEELRDSTAKHGFSLLIAQTRHAQYVGNRIAVLHAVRVVGTEDDLVGARLVN